MAAPWPSPARSPPASHSPSMTRKAPSCRRRRPNGPTRGYCSSSSSAAAPNEDRRPIEGLHFLLGETLMHLGRPDEAEAHFRAERRLFPRNLCAYESLAVLLHEAQRAGAVQEVLEALVDAVPTPEGYRTAARLWTAVGQPARAAAVKAAARERFRQGPSVARLEPGARR